ncbi:MAG: TIM barrel protein [Verrucomicrobiota bacterium]|nr:TIM barrel protein [Verrucomicrobiota bacterium]
MYSLPPGFAFSTLGCPKLDLPGVIALAKNHGVTQLEWRVFENRLDLPAYFSERFASYTELAEYLKREEMQVCCIDTSFALLGHDQEQRNALEAFVSLAEAVGAPYLRIFGGGKEPALTPEQLTSASNFYRWWRNYKQINGIHCDVLVETHDQLVDTDQCLRLIKHIGPDFLILWDTHHIWRNKEEHPRHTWQQLRANIRHIHIKDSIFRDSALNPTSGMNYRYVLPGTGEFPLLETIAMLRGKGSKVPKLVISLEWEKLWHPTLAPLDDALEALASILQRGMEEKKIPTEQ